MEPFLGQIQPFGFNFPPRGWALCDGQILPINQNQALFSLLGTTFGGDGRTTFGLPELRGRSIVHVGSGPGLDTITWGERSGQYQIQLTTNNLPSHTHTGTLQAGSGLGNAASAGGNQLAANTGADTVFNSSGTPTAMASGNVNISNTGGSQSFNSRNPFLGIYVSIALVGLFPSRS